MEGVQMTLAQDANKTIRLTKSHVIHLTPEQLARCRELSYGDEGYMCDDLDIILEYEPKSRRPWHRRATACLAYLDGTIVGWSLLQPVPRSPRWTVQLFVDPDHRRQGIGKLLLVQANSWTGFKHKPIVIKDEDNEEFFNRYPHLHTED